jgi:anti-sigma factor RsiW
VNRPQQRRGGTPDPHLPFEELAVGYALSALEPDEQARFTDHVSSCARCERDVREHQATLTQLAHAAPSVEPPPSILEGIRAGVRAEARSAAAEAWAPLPSPPDELADRRRRTSVQVRRSHLLVSAAAAAALLLGLGGWNAALQRDNAEQGERVANLATAVKALESEDTRTVRLASPEGQVLAVAVVQGEQMSLVVDGLRPNADDSVYVLWGQSRYGDVRAVGTFDVERNDLDVLPGLRLEPGVGELTALMVTHEQGRTAPAVSAEPVVVTGDV